MEPRRRLVVIMFADIVGYTAMMQVDERQALAKLDRYKQVQKELVHKYEGEILKYVGDACLTVFTSVLNALNCALEVQKRLRESPQVPVRIGIHTGEILYSEEDVYGDGINIAARLQALGVAGSVLFSRDVYNKIKNHPELHSTYLGKYQLKNVLSEMNVYALANPGVVVPEKGGDSSL